MLKNSKIMQESKTSMAETLRRMGRGETVSIALGPVKYMSVASTLYRLRLEGMEYTSRISPDKTYVTVIRIS